MRTFLSLGIPWSSVSVAVGRRLPPCPLQSTLCKSTHLHKSQIMVYTVLLYSLNTFTELHRRRVF